MRTTHNPLIAGPGLPGKEGSAPRSVLVLVCLGSWKGNELGYRSCSGDFAGGHLRVEIIATGGNMRLGDIKNIMSHISLDKLMLQLK